MTKAIRRAALNAVLWTAAFFGAVVFVAHQPGSFTVIPSPMPHAHAVTVSQHLMALHRCWAGAAPKGVTFPGHVVTNHGYGGSAAVGRALDHVFKGLHPALKVYGFCR